MLEANLLRNTTGKTPDSFAVMDPTRRPDVSEVGREC
jgi:hypothetical protein